MATERKESLAKDSVSSDRLVLPRIDPGLSSSNVHSSFSSSLPPDGLPEISGNRNVFLRTGRPLAEVEEEDEDKSDLNQYSDHEEDDDYDTDLEEEDQDFARFQKLLDLDKSTRSYLEVCRQMRIQPNASVREQLQRSELNLRHTSFSREEIFTVLIALCANTTITSLVLADCGLTIENLGKLSDVLEENTHIQSIDLSHNHLASTGAKIVGRILERSKRITTVKLSACGFSDDDCACLCEPLLDDNRYLVAVDLSHNKFRESAGLSLKELISQNDTIRTLDLSWNHLRRKGAIDVAGGLGRNTTLTSLNLAYNGFGDEGAAAIGQALTENDSLERLNLTNNRISNRGAIRVGEALKKNQSLQSLKISENPISPYGVRYLLDGVKVCNSLIQLDIRSLPVDVNGMQILIDINKQGNRNSIFHAKFGACLKKEVKDYANPDYVVKMEIFDQIREHLDINNLRMLDLFNHWWKDKKNGGLTVDQLKHGLDQANIPVTKNMLGRVFKAFDKNDNGIISYDEFSWGIQ